VTLPPPARMDFRAAAGDLPRDTHMALSRLLGACGVDYEFKGELPRPNSLATAGNLGTRVRRRAVSPVLFHTGV